VGMKALELVAEDTSDMSSGDDDEDVEDPSDVRTRN
jgi:hypothetical protein